MDDTWINEKNSGFPPFFACVRFRSGQVAKLLKPALRIARWMRSMRGEGKRV
jgi:hypothetical protein